MAGEITVVSRLVVNNSNLIFDTTQISSSIDQAAVGGPTPGYLTIGTTEETYAFPELSTIGEIWMRNLDDTNYVQWGRATGSYIGRMKPGRTAHFTAEPGITLYLKANTAACKILLYALEA